MNIMRKNALAAMFMIVATAGLMFAQVTVPRRFHYSINVPYKMRMGDYLLPAGKYLLYQINSNDRNLFALYKGEDRIGTPIAMIRTVAISDLHDVDEATVILEVEESSGDPYAVIKGWNAPGESGWEIISVYPDKDNRVLTRIK
ncbi:MAG TPA: hypothetical protein VNO70_07570 [Blastocatellia bacterium]|nr:hypothetical protein [Blastocatellia bacterium]